MIRRRWLGAALMAAGLALWFSCGDPVWAETLQASVTVTQPPSIRLLLVDSELNLGSGQPGATVSDSIAGTVVSNVAWKLTYTARDFSDGTHTIPISRVTVDGTDLSTTSLGYQGVIYDNKQPAQAFMFQHTFSLSIPGDAEPGAYTASIEYTVTPAP